MAYRGIAASGGIFCIPLLYANQAAGIVHAHGQTGRPSNPLRYGKIRSFYPSFPCAHRFSHDKSCNPAAAFVDTTCLYDMTHI